MRLIWLVTGVFAAALFAAFAVSLWLTRHSETRFPPVGPRVEVGDALLHYADDGEGPTIVLIHGAGANLRDFETSLVPRLTPLFRVIRVDRPGSGYSKFLSKNWLDPAQQAASISRLLDRLDIPRAVWVGHSWGGSLVMAGLLAEPQRVSGGVLLAGAAYPWAGGVDLADELPSWPLAGPLLARTIIPPLGHLMLDRGTASVFTPNAPVPGYRAKTGIALYLRPGQFTATARDIRRLSPFLEQQAPRYAEITNPLLLVHGTDDTIVPAWNHADRLARLLPQAESLRLEDTGHAPHHVHADRVAERIRVFALEALGHAP